MLVAESPTPSRGGGAHNQPEEGRRELTVAPESSGTRLDTFLFRHGGFPSRSQAARQIAAGKAWVGGQIRRAGYRLKTGDRVAWLPFRPPDEGIAPEEVPFQSVYEDGEILVVNKPAGVVVHPGAGNLEKTLVAGLLFAGKQLASLGGPKRPGIVHRLDRDTSGLLIVAKTDASYVRLQQMLKQREIKRTYLLFVGGVPSPPQGRIETPYGRDRRLRTRMSARVESGGRRAVTRYRLVTRGARSALVEAQLDTGRTHQIRVHFALIGHPVVGDKVYGRAPSRLWASRQLLHAWELSFCHPASGEELSFHAPPPEDFHRFSAQEGIDLPPSPMLSSLYGEG